MASVGSLSRHLNLDEIAQPRVYPSIQSAAVRQAAARTNLGITSTAAEAAVLSGATPGTAVPSKAVVLDANRGFGGMRNTSTLQEYAQAAPGTLNATGTLTAALILTGIVTSTTGAAVVATLDTGTLFETGLIAIYPNLQNNDSIEFTVINTGANTFTIATAANWTDGGGGFTAVAAGTSGRFLARRTAANTYTLYKVA